MSDTKDLLLLHELQVAKANVADLRAINADADLATQSLQRSYDSVREVSIAKDAEIERLRAINAELLAALELFVKQWNACGPNSDFGHHFTNVLMASEAAIARARHETFTTHEALAGRAP